MVAYSRLDATHSANHKTMFQDANRKTSELAFSSDTVQIIALQEALRKSRAEHQVCAVALEELKFLNTHQIRHSVCQILSLSELLERAAYSKKAESLVSFIKIAALSLDSFSRKMTTVFERRDVDECRADKE
jgi:hypothetical protein